MLAILLAGCPAPELPPNVLIVTLDTTRADAIGAYGARDAHTPTWDALAAEGVRFTRTYTVTPLTIPAHSSLMTGLWPPRHGVRDNGDYFLSPDALTLAERMQDAGYTTMASVGAEVTSHHWGFAQGFDAFFDDMGHSPDEQNNRWRVERRGDAVVDDALGWLGTRDRTKPFFAWVHLFDAHHPYAAPAPFAKGNKSPYAAEVSYADSQLGRLIDALKATHDLDHTWVLVMADHGEGLGSHGEAMHGVLLYDATTHIPLVIRAPGGGKGTTVDFATSLVDIVPTVLDAAGRPAPEGIDGLDLAPWIRGANPASAPRSVYAESLYAFHHYGWAPQRALVDDTHKLIDSTTPELYEKGDATEATDLALTDAARLLAMQTTLMGMASAMTPIGGATEVHLSSDQEAQLAALGYLTSEATPDPALAKGLPDPVDRLPVLRDVESARQALQRGDLAEARVKLEAVRATDPGLEEPRRMLVTVLLSQGELDLASALAEEADQAGNSSAKLLLAHVRMRQGRYPDALAALHAALELDPYLEVAWAPYLHLLFATQAPTFQPELERARQALPDSTTVQAMTGVELASRGEFSEALPLLQGALLRDPKQALVHHYLGLASLAAQDTARAEDEFREEIAVNPPSIPSRQMLVRLFADQSRYDDQLAELSTIETFEPPNPLTMHSTAQALFNLGRYDEANKRVTECRAFAPTYAGCAMLEANVLKKLGHEKEAYAAYENALALAGETPPAKLDEARAPNAGDLPWSRPER